MRQQPAARIGDRIIILQRSRHQKFSFLAIADDRSRSAINRQPRPFRLHQRRNVLFHARRKHAIYKPIRHHALVVVGKYHAIDTRKRRHDQSGEFFLGVSVKRLARLAIHPYNLLISRDHTRFQSRRTAAVGENSLPRQLQHTQARSQSRSRFVIARHSKSFNARAERGEIRSHVSRTAQTFAFFRVIDDRHSGFRRKPRRRSPNIAVEHPVADHSNAPASESRNQRFQAAHRDLVFQSRRHISWDEHLRSLPRRSRLCRARFRRAMPRTPREPART